MMLNNVQHTMTRTALHLPLLLLFLATFFLNPVSTQAIGNFDGIFGFEDFSQSVQNGEGDVLRGVYVENVLELPVVQQSFSRLALGQEVRLVYGDGTVKYFVIKQILRFQALDPESVSSSFRNLDRNEILPAGEMFNRIYVGEHRLVFQTCIEAQGNVSWGRLFVVALPKE
jgi:hypothetical protein